MREKNQFSLPEDDKGNLFIAGMLIILAIAAIVLSALLIADNSKIDKLEGEITERNLEIALLKDEVIKSRDIIANYDELVKKLYVQIDEHVDEKSRLMASVNFLTPWAKKIVDRLEKTVDLRSLTIINCDDIACWLFEQAKKYREWKVENETKEN